MSDWSQLQSDLMYLVVSRINVIEDYLSFSSVCKSWHSVATKDNYNSDLPRVPWLMLAEDEDDNTRRKFFSLSNGMILKKNIPGVGGKRCVESMGWIITVEKDEDEINLLHPFSGVQIQLPHQIQISLPHQNNIEYYIPNNTFEPHTFIRKAILSANPSHTSNYILMVIQGGSSFLSLWRPGDLLWTRLQAFNGHISDVTYFNDNFYAIDYRSCIQVCDVGGSKPDKSHIIVQLDPWIDGIYYILESLGSLFIVAQQFVGIRNVTDDGEENMSNTCKTKKILVYQIDLDACKATTTRNLGDRAFFMGASASLSVQASQFPGIKPNHIYFTDNYLGAYLRFEERCGLDMGVFNLADGSIQTHYDGVSLSRVCPPIWVTPNPS